MYVKLKIDKVYKSNSVAFLLGVESSLCGYFFF